MYVLQVHGLLVAEASEWARAEALLLTMREPPALSHSSPREDEDDPVYAILHLCIGQQQDAVQPKVATRKER